ncbi:hypothetical protein TorRG33x02_224070 [Trema orientale]|uniref:Uncharacterized protein n=1 Tax=Trema orientale TaxID=63057 RepID=A0A2P5E8D8_TREOI|nr:hypothetical protein TorRG33x02_224070 [Trema orientale]
MELATERSLTEMYLSRLSQMRSNGSFTTLSSSCRHSSLPPSLYQFGIRTKAASLTLMIYFVKSLSLKFGSLYDFVGSVSYQLG